MKVSINSEKNMVKMDFGDTVYEIQGDDSHKMLTVEKSDGENEKSIELILETAAYIHIH
jgi:hypothetical protein